MTSNNGIIVDKNFNIPPGVIDMYYGGEWGITDDFSEPGGSSEASSDDTIVPVDYDLGEIDIDYSQDNISGLYPPTMVTVISQTIRMDGAGNSVVDVVIEVPDNSGADQIGVRLTKV